MKKKIKNISGVFPLEIQGKKRDTFCTFGVIENLERVHFERPVISVLNDALNGKIFVINVVDAVMEGLHANKDTRFDRNDIGEEIIKRGMDEFIAWFIIFLTYAISGDKSLEVNKTVDVKKK